MPLQPGSTCQRARRIARRPAVLGTSVAGQRFRYRATPTAARSDRRCDRCGTCHPQRCRRPRDANGDGRADPLPPRQGVVAPAPRSSRRRSRQRTRRAGAAHAPTLRHRRKHCPRNVSDGGVGQIGIRGHRTIYRHVLVRRPARRRYGERGAGGRRLFRRLARRSGCPARQHPRRRRGLTPCLDAGTRRLRTHRISPGRRCARACGATRCGTDDGRDGPRLCPVTSRSARRRTRTRGRCYWRLAADGR